MSEPQHAPQHALPTAAPHAPHAPHAGEASFAAARKVGAVAARLATKAAASVVGAVAGGVTGVVQGGTAELRSATEPVVHPVTERAGGLFQRLKQGWDQALAETLEQERATKRKV